MRRPLAGHYFFPFLTPNACCVVSTVVAVLISTKPTFRLYRRRRSSPGRDTQRGPGSHFGLLYLVLWWYIPNNRALC